MLEEPHWNIDWLQEYPCSQPLFHIHRQIGRKENQPLGFTPLAHPCGCTFRSPPFGLLATIWPSLGRCAWICAAMVLMMAPVRLYGCSDSISMICAQTCSSNSIRSIMAASYK